MTEYYKLEPVTDVPEKRKRKNRAFMFTLMGIVAIFAVTITTASVLQDKTPEAVAEVQAAASEAQ